MSSPAEEKSLQIPSDLASTVGQRISVDKFRGTIRYAGPVATSKNSATTWLGIEWDDQNRGKHDGSVTTSDNQSHRYFTCEAGKGSFIKPVKANFGRDLLTVILDRFSLDGLEDDIKEQEKIASDSSYKIEFVGWDKSIRRQCNLQKKLAVNIEEYDVTHIDLSSLDELRKSVPEVEQLELRRNLITSLQSFVGLRCLGDTLKELNLSHNRLHSLSFQTIGQLFADDTGFSKASFPCLEHLYLNNCASAAFQPWQFVYMLGINGCLPKITELQLCCNNMKHLKLPAHIIANEKEGNPNVFADENTGVVPDGKRVAHMFPCLKDVNLGENPCSDFAMIGDVFGACGTLTHLQCSYMHIEQIEFRAGVLESVNRMWFRNNKWNNLSVLDELNKFPNLHQLNFLENTFQDTYGHNTLRDLAIAKIANLRVCNSSLVNAKERHDAELFYLKWIGKQMADEKRKNADGNKDGEGSDESKEDEVKREARIEALFPRYIELVKKHGALNFDKQVQEKLMAVTVSIKSMDPESITAKPVSKKLPTSMTVAQLKMLCKRLFQLKPQHQRLTYREANSQAFPDDMYDDTKPLSFYNIKDGAEVLMQSSNFDRK